MAIVARTRRGFHVFSIQSLYTIARIRVQVLFLSLCTRHSRIHSISSTNSFRILYVFHVFSIQSLDTNARVRVQGLFVSLSTRHSRILSVSSACSLLILYVFISYPLCLRIHSLSYTYPFHILYLSIPYPIRVFLSVQSHGRNSQNSAVSLLCIVKRLASWLLRILAHTATCCNTLQRTATRCNTLQDSTVTH